MFDIWFSPRSPSSVYSTLPTGKMTGSALKPARDGDAELHIGNLPSSQPNRVHVVDDVWIVASGPGSEKVNGVLDNAEAFFVIMNGLGIHARRSV